MKQIRKISIGNGHPDNSIHYQVGKTYNLSNNQYTLTDIIQDKDLFSIGVLAYNIYIADSRSKVIWKTIKDVSCVIEYNIDFD